MTNKKDFTNALKTAKRADTAYSLHKGEKICCKHICANCGHYKESAIFQSDGCTIVDKEKLNCVTGESERIFIKPRIANKNGNCPHYKECKQKILWNKLRDITNEYYSEIFMNYQGGDYTEWSEYQAVSDLIEVLDRPRKYGIDKNKIDATITYHPKLKKKHWWKW